MKFKEKFFKEGFVMKNDLDLSIEMRKDAGGCQLHIADFTQLSVNLI